jgi:hypothetical protein
MRILADRKLLALLALAMGLRLAVALATDIPPDSGEFRYVALTPRSGLGTQGAPLYPLFLRLVYGLFGTGNDAAALLVQAPLGALIVVPMYLAAARLFGRPAGLVSAAIAAVYPNFVLYPAAVQPAWLVALTAAALSATCAVDASESGRAVLAAALTAIGLLVRPYFLYMIPGLLAVLKHRILFLAALIALLAPVAARNSIVAGRFVPVYEAHSFNLNVSEYASGNAERIIDRVYSNAFRLFWYPDRSHRQTDHTSPAFRLYHLRKYSYLILLLFGLVTLVRRISRAHLASAAPLLSAVALHIVFSRSPFFRIRTFLEIATILYTGALFYDWGCAARSRFGGKSSKAA